MSSVKVVFSIFTFTVIWPLCAKAAVGIMVSSIAMTRNNDNHFFLLSCLKMILSSFSKKLWLIEVLRIAGRSCRQPTPRRMKSLPKKAPLQRGTLTDI